MIQEISDAMKGPVLIVDDDPLMCQSLEAFLQLSGIATEAFTSPANAVEKVREGLGYGLGLIDKKYDFASCYTGERLYNELKGLRPHIPVMILTGDLDDSPW